MSGTLELGTVVADHIEDSSDVLDVEGLTISLDLGDDLYPVILDVDLRVRRGERLAIVGESGSGKSMTALSLLRLLPATAEVRADRLEVCGRELLDLDDAQLRSMRGGDAAMIFQDPMSSLNPLMRIESQFAGPLRRHLGLGRREARTRATELLARVGIPDPQRCLRAYPHELSGGMRQRVMIAIAISCGPSLLLADEPTTALDVTIQAQIIELLRELTDQFGMGCILVTHDLGVVARFAHRVAVMYAGRIVEEAPVEQLFAAPRHPYTQALLASIPAPGGTDRLYQIDGVPPSLRNRVSGCPFRPRCSLAHDACAEAAPPLMTTEDGAAQVACFAVEEAR